MTTTLRTEAPPLRTEPDGTIRVGTSRIPLERIVQAFQRGDSPELIAMSYPTVSLTEVYGVVAYYLRHRAEIDAYIAQQELDALELRRTIEVRQGGQVGLRERLLARPREKKDGG